MRHIYPPTKQALILYRHHRWRLPVLTPRPRAHHPRLRARARATHIVIETTRVLRGPRPRTISPRIPERLGLELLPQFPFMIQPVPTFDLGVLLWETLADDFPRFLFEFLGRCYVRRLDLLVAGAVGVSRSVPILRTRPRGVRRSARFG